MRRRIFLYCTMGPWMLTTGEPLFIKPVSTPVQPGWLHMLKMDGEHQGTDQA